MDDDEELTPGVAQDILEDDENLNLSDAMTKFFSHMLCQEADRWDLKTAYKHYWAAVGGSSAGFG